MQKSVQKSGWLYLFFFVVSLLMFKTPAFATQSPSDSGMGDVTHYECVDENGDQQCDAPPED